MPENETTHFTTLDSVCPNGVKQLGHGEYLFRGVPNEAYGIQASAISLAQKATEILKNSLK